MRVLSLDDGTAVWLDPMRDVRSVSLGVYVAGGSADERPENLGSTHYLEHLLFKRTRRRSGASIARTTDRLGGDCDAYTTKESVAFHAQTTGERAGEALELLLDLTEAPAFTGDDVEVERGVILEEMAEANDVPEDRLNDAFLRALWPEHPLGAPILGTDGTVRSLTRRVLVERFRAIFRPERTVIVAVGAFDPGRFFTKVQRAVSLRRRRTVAPGLAFRRGAAARRPRSARCAFHLPRPDLAQTHLLVGASTIETCHRLVPAAWLAAVILGGGVSSRLWREVRERRGLAYSVGTSISLHRDAGVSRIEAATTPKNLPGLVRTTGRVVRRFLEDGVTRAELSRAKSQIETEVALSLESTASRREAASRAWLYRGKPYEADDYLAEVRRATADDVAEAADLLFGSLGLAVTGPSLAGATLEDLAGDLAA